MSETLGLALLNLALVVGLAPLAEGVMRRVRAIVHSRKGPPLIQPYLDLLKLLVKEDLRPTTGLLWQIAPASAPPSPPRCSPRWARPRRSPSREM